MMLEAPESACESLPPNPGMTGCRWTSKPQGQAPSKLPSHTKHNGGPPRAGLPLRAQGALAPQVLDHHVAGHDEANVEPVGLPGGWHKQ